MPRKDVLTVSFKESRRRTREEKKAQLPIVAFSSRVENMFLGQ